MFLLSYSPESFYPHYLRLSLSLSLSLTLLSSASLLLFHPNLVNFTTFFSCRGILPFLKEEEATMDPSYPTRSSPHNIAGNVHRQNNTTPQSNAMLRVKYDFVIFCSSDLATWTSYIPLFPSSMHWLTPRSMPCSQFAAMSGNRNPVMVQLLQHNLKVFWELRLLELEDDGGVLSSDGHLVILVCCYC